MLHFIPLLTLKVTRRAQGRTVTALFKHSPRWSWHLSPAIVRAPSGVVGLTVQQLSHKRSAAMGRGPSTAWWSPTVTPSFTTTGISPKNENANIISTSGCIRPERTTPLRQAEGWERLRDLTLAPFDLTVYECVLSCGFLSFTWRQGHTCNYEPFHAALKIEAETCSKIQEINLHRYRMLLPTQPSGSGLGTPQAHCSLGTMTKCAQIYKQNNYFSHMSPTWV